MPVQIEDVNAISWIWHDAVLLSFAYEQSGDWTYDLVLRCEIHPDEDRSLLTGLGIHTSKVSVRFANVEKFSATIHSPVGRKSFVYTWDLKDDTHYVTTGIGLFNVSCWTVWLAEAAR